MDDQAVVGGERGVMGVDGIERECGCGRQFDEFGTGRLQFPAESVMLDWLCEVGLRGESQVLPLGCVIGFIPSGGAWRTDEDALECADHGVSVETRLGNGSFVLITL